MPEATSAPVTLKCKVCGGDLRNDYLAGACVCAHCGNKWSLEDLVPDYKKYSRAITKINQAKEMLDLKADISSAGQAMLLYKGAMYELTSHTDAIASDLTRVCKEGLERADQTKHYAMGMTHFEKNNFRRALTEFQKVPGFRDADELIEQCKAQVLIERKKRIPLAILIGMVIPLVLCILLKEEVGVPFPALIPIFIILTAGVSYAVYLEGTLSKVILVLSFLSAVPLILFMIMAYGLHMETKTAAVTAVVAPIAVIILLAVKPERKT